MSRSPQLPYDIWLNIGTFIDSKTFRKTRIYGLNKAFWCLYVSRVYFEALALFCHDTERLSKAERRQTDRLLDLQ